MAYSQKELEVINFLESLVHQRFNLESLASVINNEFNSNIKFELTDDSDNDENTRTDYNLIGTIEFKDVYIDVDVYYLPHRFAGFDGATFLVTEVGYEVQ